MKKKLYKIFRSKIYFRCEEIKRKQAERLKRVQHAQQYLYMWRDQPVGELYGGVCRILEIKPDEGAIFFIHDLIIADNIEKIARVLPLK